MITQTRGAAHALVATMVTLAMSACAVGRDANTVSVPENLRATPSASLGTVAMARGVQIYRCSETKGTPGTYAWVLVAPEADLFDANGARIGRHFAGPAWEANDGSRIVGTVRERADAPNADAIPWLLLATKASGPDGAFSHVIQVQRIATAGGVAPAASACTQTAEGTSARVPYTAEYRFWTASGAYASY